MMETHGSPGKIGDGIGTLHGGKRDLEQQNLERRNLEQRNFKHPLRGNVAADSDLDC